MDPVAYSVVVILILIFFALLGYLTYQYLEEHVDRRVQIRYALNDPRFRRGGWRRRCPAGCVKTGDRHDSKSGWACPNGSFCYNSVGRHATCCSYDSQCANC